MSTKTYALTNATRLKSRLTITSADFDTLFAFLAFSATDFIQSQCSGRQFKSATYSNELYDGSILGQEDSQRNKYLILKNAPITTLTSVEYLSGSRTSPSWTAFTADDYVSYASMGMIYFPSGMPAGVQNIRVTYTAGYLLDLAESLYDDTKNTVPFELIDLVERLCVKVFKRRESEGKSQETFGESSISWGSYLESADWAILKNYKRVFAL